MTKIQSFLEKTKISIYALHAKIAEKENISYPAVRMVVVGSRIPSVIMAMQIADALNEMQAEEKVSVYTFWEGEHRSKKFSGRGIATAVSIVVFIFAFLRLHTSHENGSTIITLEPRFSPTIEWCENGWELHLQNSAAHYSMFYIADIQEIEFVSFEKKNN